MFEQEYNKEYYKQLMNFLDEEYKNYDVYPPRENIFTAFELTPLKEVKVVILGQDPYHGVNQAHGLAFSVNAGVRIPPSLINIYKEINRTEGGNMPTNGNLIRWAKQGVLLLNTVLTVRAGLPNSHKDKGWEIFTDKIIKTINKKEMPVVFLLWGNNAIKKENLITNPIHCVLKTTHPSPLSANKGFLGCGHFRDANEFLIRTNQTPINWVE
ncbi:MAG: uracil-DNA glycosylase [Epulopiscium sp. Nuni2H_MBin003]|nr:MAG: uracil-DNA glycosylase [Epulopiscium sp. Nuni2H_MBin003]